MSEACKAFLSLSMAIYLIVSSKVRKWTVNLGWPFSLIFSMIEMILWWCFYFSIDTNTGFMQRSMLNREFSIGILNNIAKYLLNVLAISVTELRISRFSNSSIFSLTVILSEKSSSTDFCNFRWSVIRFGSKFEKYSFLLFAKGLDIGCVIFCKHVGKHVSIFEKIITKFKSFHYSLAYLFCHKIGMIHPTNIFSSGPRLTKTETF